MKHLKTFEKHSTENIEDFVKQLGDERSNDSITIGWGKPCGDCNCVVEECNCGCESCKRKQKQGQVFNPEPVKLEYHLDKKPAKSIPFKKK
jgi:hypothetical protein